MFPNTCLRIIGARLVNGQGPSLQSTVTRDQRLCSLLGAERQRRVCRATFRTAVCVLVGRGGRAVGDVSGSGRRAAAGNLPGDGWPAFGRRLLPTAGRQPRTGPDGHTVARRRRGSARVGAVDCPAARCRIRGPGAGLAGARRQRYDRNATGGRRRTHRRISTHAGGPARRLRLAGSATGRGPRPLRAGRSGAGMQRGVAVRRQGPERGCDRRRVTRP